MHIQPDFKTKKEFREAFAKGVKIRVFDPVFTREIYNGTQYVEAPAKYHKWYAQVTTKNGIITKIVN